MYSALLLLNRESKSQVVAAVSIRLHGVCGAYTAEKLLKARASLLELYASMLLELDSSMLLELDSAMLELVSTRLELDSCGTSTPYTHDAQSPDGSVEFESPPQLAQKIPVSASAIFFQYLKNISLVSRWM